MAATWNYWGSSSPSSGNHPFCFKISETKICIYIYTYLILFIYIICSLLHSRGVSHGALWGRTIISKVRLAPWIWRLGGCGCWTLHPFWSFRFPNEPHVFRPNLQPATMAAFIHRSRRKDLKMRSVMEHSLRIRWDTVSTSLGKLGKLGMFPPPPQKRGSKGVNTF